MKILRILWLAAFLALFPVTAYSADIYDWSTTAGDNDDADSSINWAEGQTPGSVNNSARAMMVRIKQLLNDLGGLGTVGGTADAITLTGTIDALESGKVVAFKAGGTNTGATTINVNSLGAKAIRRQGDTALSAGDIVSGGIYLLRYESTFNSAAGAWVLLNASGQVAAPADPNADRIFFWDDSDTSFQYLTLTPNLVISGTELRQYEVWGGAVSDETTAITTGTGKLSFSIPYNFVVVGVYATLNTVSSSGTPTFDVNEGGTTIISTKIVVDVSELTGGSSGYQGTAAGAAVISDTAIAAFAQITIDIDVAGTGAKGAKVFIIGYRTS